VQSYFYELADQAGRLLTGNERFTASFSGEDSDFCRLSGAKVRQAGRVKQAQLSLRLIDGKRNVEGALTLSTVALEDRERLAGLVKALRENLAASPEDPYLLYNETPCSTERRATSELPDPHETIARVAEAGKGLDLVGIYAAGGIMRGFANSLGQRNWFETYSFNFDFSLYLRADKAVKSGYAGFRWQDGELARKLDKARRELSVLDKAPRELVPGRYRVYLAPSAVQEIADMLSWGGFSEKARRTKHSPLLRLYEGEVRLSSQVTMREDTQNGLSPDFNAAGFVKPAAVPLVEAGVVKGSLVSARTAKEYGIDTNGADGREAPQSFDVAAGTLAEADAASLVGDGLYINNLWYLNFSDRSACRVTGMTRFATFWVEGGKVVAPVPVMRFDESVLRMFGEQLVGLTKEREFIMSSSSYGQRATTSQRLPGMLVDGFALTL
jgi:predicted Zn-dependent protease